MYAKKYLFIAVSAMAVLPSFAHADENIFGYVRGAETLPKGTFEYDQTITYRGDKGVGTYHAWDSKSELEYGVTDRLEWSNYIKAQSIHTEGIVVDAYIPGDESYGLRASGVETELKYNFLSPAKDDFGLAGLLSLSYDWLDRHSGLDKDSYAVETALIAQKYFMEGQLTWAGNIGLEATHARRAKLSDSRAASLPADFDWPDNPEMEIEVTLRTGLSYRFMPNWSAGVEVEYQSEYETVVDQERWSVFAGPNIHYGGDKFWATLTWFPQIKGYGNPSDAQIDNNLQLIEKTKQEVRLKFGIDF